MLSCADFFLCDHFRHAGMPWLSNWSVTAFSAQLSEFKTSLQFYILHRTDPLSPWHRSFIYPKWVKYIYTASFSFVCPALAYRTHHFVMLYLHKTLLLGYLPTCMYVYYFAATYPCIHWLICVRVKVVSYSSTLCEFWVSEFQTLSARTPHYNL